MLVDLRFDNKYLALRVFTGTANALNAFGVIVSPRLVIFSITTAAYFSISGAGAFIEREARELARESAALAVLESHGVE